MAPTCRVTSRPFLNNAIVGIALMRKRRARFCASSVLTFATTHYPRLPAPPCLVRVRPSCTDRTMAPKNPPTREEQNVRLRHRMRDRLPHRLVRPVRLVRCHISRSARFRPACRISDDCADHTSGRSPIHRGHPLVSSSSKTLSSQPMSVGRHLHGKRFGSQHRTSNSTSSPLHWALGVRRSVFGVRCLLRP